MTLDVTIGKVVLEREEEDGHAYPYVDQCPDSDTPICDEEFTVWPYEAYRSGSSGFWKFFLKTNDKLTDIYNRMRWYPQTNDRDVAYLDHFVHEIMAIDLQEFETALDRDRMKWLQYWTLKALTLYGTDAGIMFS